MSGKRYPEEFKTKQSNRLLIAVILLPALQHVSISPLKWHTEFGHLNRGDMLTSEQHRCSNEKKKF